jgi:hypothetical protein
MARFGRSFVQAATQPQYAQGLFTAAQDIASAPRRRREEEEKRKTYSMLAGIQSDIYSTLQNEDLTDAERATRLDELKKSALTASENIEGINPLTVEGMVRTARRDVFAEQEQRRQSERADERLELSFKNLGLQEAAANRAAEKHKEFMGTAEYRQAQRDFQTNQQLHTTMVQAAEGFSTTEQGRENFIKAYGEDKVGIFDAIKTKNDTAIAQRDKILSDAEQGKFTFTKNDLMEKHGFDEKAANNLLAVAKQSPKRASEIFANYLFKTQKRVEVPSAYVSLFQEAAMTQAEKELKAAATLPLGIAVTDEEIESKAARMALAAAEAYVASGGSFDAAMQAVTGESVRSDLGQTATEDPMAELRRLSEQYSSVDDAKES